MRFAEGHHFPFRKTIFNSAQYFATVIFAPIMGWLTHEVGWLAGILSRAMDVLAALFAGELGAEVEVRRNDALTLA
jgi:hypothetical protein